MTGDLIPVIDAQMLREGPNQRRACAMEIARACREIGFFHVVNHGIEQDLVDEAFDVAQRYFSLPVARKMENLLSAQSHYCGYFPLKGEVTDPKIGADPKEGYDIAFSSLGADADGPIWPTEPVDLSVTLTRYHEALSALAQDLSRGFALALDLPEDFFSGRLDQPTSILRLLHFPAMYLAAATGDVELLASAWKPLQNAFYERAGGDGSMVRLGTLIEGATQGYFFDTATAEEYGITTFDQLQDPEIAALFSNDGSGRAQLFGCPPGWGCERAIEHHLDAFELRDTVDHIQGDMAVIASEIIARHASGDPVVYYTYNPLWGGQVLVAGEDVVQLTVPFTSLSEPTDPALTTLEDGRNAARSVASDASGTKDRPSLQDAHNVFSALASVDLEVQHNETLAIVGQSGI